MIPNSLKTKIKDLTSREILKEAILIRDIENGDNLIEVETVSNNVNIDTIEKLKKKIIDLQIPVDASNFFVKKQKQNQIKYLKDKPFNLILKTKSWQAFLFIRNNSGVFGIKKLIFDI